MNTAPMTTDSTVVAEQLRRVRPRADVLESEQAYEIVLELPGVGEEKVDIALEGKLLSIRAEMGELAPAGHELLYGEYRRGEFVRQFTLGDAVDRDGIGAGMADGVLRLSLPKAAHVLPRKIEIRREG